MGVGCLSKPSAADDWEAHNKAQAFARDVAAAPVAPGKASSRKGGGRGDAVHVHTSSLDDAAAPLTPRGAAATAAASGSGGSSSYNHHLHLAATDGYEEEDDDDVVVDGPDVITAQGGSDTVLLELFTSHGCSGSPAADDILSELLASGGSRAWGRVVPLGFHCCIWNYGGHSDPFSDRRWDQRQKLYSEALEPLRGVYTPQLVVNGRTHVGGGNKINVFRALDAEARRIRKAAPGPASAARNPGARRRKGAAPAPAVSMTLSLLPPAATQALARKGSGGKGGKKGGGRGARKAPHGPHVALRVETLQPAASPDDEFAIFAALVEHGLLTKVKKGENKGRTLRNDAVVRCLRQVAIVGGDLARHTATARLPLPPSCASAPPERLGVAVWIQHTGTLAVAGAVASALSAQRGLPFNVYGAAASSSDEEGDATDEDEEEEDGW